MSPTLLAGDYLLVRGVSASKQALARGAVVVVADQRHEQRILKRVIGLPKEQITFTDGTLLIDGRSLLEPYLRGMPPYLGLDDSDYALGPDEYFVMGDNRAHSTDSRHHGPLSWSQIVGRAVWRVLPPSQWGKL